MARTIDLEERKQFRVLLNPVRQDIIHLLRRAGRPMTANTVAEKMLLSPSAAQSHLNKLEELGLFMRASGVVDYNNPSVEGASQSIDEGTLVTPGTVVEVRFVSSVEYGDQGSIGD